MIIKIEKEDLRGIEQLLRVVADNFVYIIEECNDPNFYLEPDVVTHLREIIKSIEELLDESKNSTNRYRKRANH